MSDTVTRNISPSPEATDCQNQFVSQVSEKFSAIFPANRDSGICCVSDDRLLGFGENCFRKTMEGKKLSKSDSPTDKAWEARKCLDQVMAASK
jgi:hypothetical protein